MSGEMATRVLGQTGMRIAPVGFGAWAISGPGWSYAWGPQDDRDSVAAIHAAVDAGVNWIDTAAVYGLGHSEEVVGRALAALPASDRPYVFTKCGLVWNPETPDAPARKLMRSDSVRRELEGSLRRLGVETIDLYQVHWPGDGRLLTGVGVSEDGSDGEHATPVEEYWQLMVDLKAEGKVRAIGLSNHDTAALQRAEAIAHVDTIQPPLSALHRDAAPEIAWAEAHGTGVIVYSPMASGLLTGAFNAARVAALPADDWRREHPDFNEGLPANLGVVAALRRVAERHAAPLPAVAVAWALAWSGVTAAIVGARDDRQIHGWVPAASLTLTATDLDDIAETIAHTGAGTGPVAPQIAPTSATS